VISADALAGPGLLALLIAIPICGVLAGLGRRGVIWALGLLGLLVAVNLMIAENVSEYGELGAIFILALAVFSLLAILIGGIVGGILRRNARANGVGAGVS
jgi:hypothetical protein